MMNMAVWENRVIEFVKEGEFAKRKRSSLDFDSEEDKRCLKLQRGTGLVESPPPRVKSSEQHSILGPRFSDLLKQRIKVVEGQNDTVSVDAPRLTCSEECFVDDDEVEEGEIVDNVLVEGEEEEDVFYKPWRDQDPLSSSPTDEQIAALVLLQLFRDVNQPQTFKERPTRTLALMETLSKSGTHTCSVCGRVFSSYQALGGHKASHRVRQPPQPLVENAEKTRTKMMAPSGKIHQCSICHVVFPTGQALGGHKRRHFEGVLGGHKRGQTDVFVSGDKSWSPTSNGSVVTNVSELEQRHGSHGMMFDLNELWVPEDGDNCVRDVEEVESAVLAIKL